MPNYFGQVIPKKLKVLTNWIRGRLNATTFFYEQIQSYIVMAKSRGGGVFED